VHRNVTQLSFGSKFHCFVPLQFTETNFLSIIMYKSSTPFNSYSMPTMVSHYKLTCISIKSHNFYIACNSPCSCIVFSYNTTAYMYMYVCVSIHRNVCMHLWPPPPHTHTHAPSHPPITAVFSCCRGNMLVCRAIS
jgi:hypothetical protein